MFLNQTTVVGWKNFSSFDDEGENFNNFTLSKLLLLDDEGYLSPPNLTANNEMKIRSIGEIMPADRRNFTAKSSRQQEKIDNNNSTTIKIDKFKNHHQRNYAWRSEYTISLIFTLIILIVCVLTFFACMKRYWRKIKPQSQSSVYSVQEGVFSDNMSLNFIDNPTDFVKDMREDDLSDDSFVVNLDQAINRRCSQMNNNNNSKISNSNNLNCNFYSQGGYRNPLMVGNENSVRNAENLDTINK